jgi:hypothetical protein
MIFEFLSNFYLTNTLSEFNANDNLLETSAKIDLTQNCNIDHYIAISTHSFSKFQNIIVYYHNITTLKTFLRRFLIECGGGKSYENDLDDILNINLGL